MQSISRCPNESRSPEKPENQIAPKRRIPNLKGIANDDIAQPRHRHSANHQITNSANKKSRPISRDLFFQDALPIQVRILRASPSSLQNPARTATRREALLHQSQLFQF